MNWFESLIFGEGIAHSIVILSIVIAIGLSLGKVKLFGISLGVTWILFVGIAASHFNLLIDPSVMSFVKDFGLILFVFSLGLQVGPGFFSSFKKGGVKLNLLAVGLILMTALTTFLIQYISKTPMPTMVGVMSGAVTNTPGLGAAQQTLFDVTGVDDSTIAMGYAVAYPLGVVGVILVVIAMRALFRVDINAEKEQIDKKNAAKDSAKKIAIEIRNEALFGKSIVEIDKLIDREFVVSRLYHTDGLMEIPTSSSVVGKGDKIFIVTSAANESAIVAFFGKKIEMEQEAWEKLDLQLVSRKLLVTKANINGKTLGELNIRAQFGINITRINRAGVDLVASPDLELQLGDRVMVVGSEKAITKVALLLGNSLNKLREPNIIPIFLGIFLGVILGSIPLMFPGIPQPVKLGLAGGPLIVAILIARFGPRLKLVTYTTLSANMMLREIGISLFLAAVGLGAGQGFVEAIVNGGYYWILEGLLITVIPLILTAIVGRLFLKLDFFTLTGIICGSQTNPIALAFSNNTYGVSQVAVAYATVYPLAMFLRVLVAQLMVL